MAEIRFVSGFFAKPTVNKYPRIKWVLCVGGMHGTLYCCWKALADWMDGPLEEQNTLNSRSVYTLFAFQLELAKRVCIVKNIHVFQFHLFCGSLALLWAIAKG